MRVPLSWLRPLIPGLTATADDIGAALLRAGLEVEHVEHVGQDVSGVVVGRVLDVEVLEGFKKPIRFCHVDVGQRVHEVVCGATNFAAGDVVPFARPGAQLPGGFTIATRQTYGRTSDGMICSAAELGLAESSDGILVLPGGSPLGSDVVEMLQLRDEVLDIAITPDRGYALSVRGVARETATAFGLELADPGLRDVPAATADGYSVRLEDPACDRYVARILTGLDTAAPSPAWLQRRLVRAGMRPISLAVDVTNAVMLETGQPLHAFDLDRLQGGIVIRRAAPGERLRTLDGTDRALDPDDLVIADESGPTALAGVMGGERTEIRPGTTTVLLESAHFAAASITRTARRHRLPSEASKRYERGVDPDLAAAAADLAVQLLVDLGGATVGPITDIDARVARPAVRLPADQPGRVAGRSYPPEVVRRRLEQVGCTVEGGEVLLVTPPSWRPDLTGSADLVEEVLRLEGYDTIPVALPSAPAGRGLTGPQRLRRTASRALAAAGLVEVVTPPFVADEVVAALGMTGHDAPRLQNPLADTESLLRPSLLPGLLSALQRNVGRGLHDVALFETGSVFRGRGVPVVEVPKTTQRPTGEQVQALDGALPVQPEQAGLVMAGSGAGVGATVETLVSLGRILRLDLAIRRGSDLPYHPGRCALLVLDGEVVGTAGELHPRVIATLGLPPRTCAGELDLGRLLAAADARGPVSAPVVSPYPPSNVDVALVVALEVLAGDVERTLRAAAGPLLEQVRLFDVYAGPQVAPGSRSLAFGLRFRAPDRTLTDVEVLAARDAAVAAAGRQHGAVLRGSA